MSNAWDDMREAVREASNTLAAADNVAAQLGQMMVGRLHLCSAWTLRDLKRELANYDLHRKSWKNRP